MPFVRGACSNLDLHVGGRTTMDNLEDIGRRLDEELARVRRYIEEDLAPETEKRTAIFLREVSEKLTSAATKLESRYAARSGQNSESKKP
ncbi:MAG TPA: hypothetical protein VK525_20565 [Candidatus Saccharimonadales bacterium]|nr:hypothetical protein [Candidatus Saccharimonadales bacterium]